MTPGNSSQMFSAPNRAGDGTDARTETMGAGTTAATGTGGLLTLEEVARLLKVPKSWVYARMRRRSESRIPAFKLGKYWRFVQSEVLSWLESLR